MLSEVYGQQIYRRYTIPLFYFKFVCFLNPKIPIFAALIPP